MTFETTPPEPRPLPGAKPRASRLLWPVILLLVLGLIAVLVQSTREVWRNAQSRRATASFADGDLLTVELRTDPNPALATGTVQLMFMPMNSRSVPQAVDELTYAYGYADTTTALGEGRAEPDGSGMYLAPAQFPAVGNYWIAATLARAGQTAEVRYTIYVKPAQ